MTCVEMVQPLPLGEGSSTGWGLCGADRGDPHHRPLPWGEGALAGLWHRLCCSHQRI